MPKSRKNPKRETKRCPKCCFGRMPIIPGKVLYSHPTFENGVLKKTTPKWINCPDCLGTAGIKS